MILKRVFNGVPGLNYITSASIANVNILKVARGQNIHNKVNVTVVNPAGSLEYGYSRFGVIVFDPENPFLDNPREKILVIYKV